MKYEIARKKMVQDQIAQPTSGDRQPVTDRRVLDAMLKIPRHIFVQEAFALQAYNDTSLPIGEKHAGDRYRLRLPDGHSGYAGRSRLYGGAYPAPGTTGT